MNTLDKLIGYFSPGAAVKREGARKVLGYYEAAEPSRMRNFYRSRGTQNELMQRSAVAIRTQTRHLIRNHDLARGALRTLVNNVVGAKGIGVEPQPRNNDGEINDEYAKTLSTLYREWCRKPEVTHQLSYSRVQRAAVRAWVRDGEIFAQMIQGNAAGLDHGSTVPFSLELFEADLVPFDLNSEVDKIVQGVERNRWGRPVALHVIQTEPWKASAPARANTTRIPWSRVLHLASMDNIGQVRGMSEFASVIQRLEDIKDYEESERVAAKIAAMLTAYVKKGSADQFDATAVADADREIKFQPGMVIDDLQSGEEIGLIDSTRPNSNLVKFRQGQLRAVASGLGGSYSSISKDYNGTYSAQRQELVEQWINYAVLTDDMVCDFVQPTWAKFVETAHLSGVARRPAEVIEDTAADAFFVAQAMPWIDPLKEALGSEALVKAGFASEIEMIRRRGGDPRQVMEQIQKWREEAAERGLVFSSNEAALQAATIASATE